LRSASAISPIPYFGFLATPGWCFLFAPVAYLVFGLRFYNATISQLFAYGAPQMIAAILTTDFMFGKFRWAFVSEIYELLQSMFSLPAIFSVLRNPRAPTFNVTPKGEYLEQDTISDLAGPFHMVYLLVCGAMVVGIWKLFHDPAHRDVIAAALMWNLLNMIMLNACIGVLYERRQRRVAPRISVDVSARLISGSPGHSEICRVTDMSAGGAQLAFASEIVGYFRSGESAILEIENAALDGTSQLSVHLCNRIKMKDGSLSIGVRFTDRSVTGLSELVSLVFGDSLRWQSYRDKRNVRTGIRRTAGIVVRLGTINAAQHYYNFLCGVMIYIKRKVRGKFTAFKDRYTIPT